jgi:hypothetical protein
MHSAHCTIQVLTAMLKLMLLLASLIFSVFLAVAGVLAVAYCTFLLSLASLLLLLHSYVPAVAGFPTVILYVLLLAPLLWLTSLYGKRPCYCWCNFR